MDQLLVYCRDGTRIFVRMCFQRGQDIFMRGNTATTFATGGSQAHTHSLSEAKSGSASNLPPYYALSYIMRIA